MPAELRLARFAPVKVNLFLEILGKRPDGYHDLLTVMETFALGDVVTAARSDALAVAADRADVPGGEANTAWKAVRAAEAALGRALPVAVELHKHVPPATGLGAGSSDAAAALDLALAAHDAAPDAAARRVIAGRVGSDVPFFVEGGLAVCTGRGEIVRPLPRRGRRHAVFLLNGVRCATPDVYRRVEVPAAPRSADALLAALAAGDTLSAPSGEASPFNRLEAAAEAAFPELKEARERATAAAGRPPLLCGSGSTHVFLCATAEAARGLAVAIRNAEPWFDVRVASSYAAEDAA